MDLGRMLRGLRRRADLSQRQLAARAGVPQATIARIEGATVRDPSWRTVERLVRAMDAELVVTTPGDAQPELPVVPHEKWRDMAGRHYAAHLDAVPVLRPEQWWGAWWASSVARSLSAPDISGRCASPSPRTSSAKMKNLKRTIADL